MDEIFKALSEGKEGFPKCYTLLFNAVSLAIRHLQDRNYGCALETLKDAQVKSEEAYLEETGGPEE